MKGEWVLFFFVIGVCCLAVLATVLVVSIAMTTEQITVCGDIKKVIPHDNYMTIILYNNQSYDIHYPGDNIDLTKGSVVIMRLTNWSPFWQESNIWKSVSITKIPEEECGC